jgi:hypothetical protein
MPKWKDALYNLSKKPPTKGIMNSIIDKMQSNYDDRTTAILVATLVEKSLIGPAAQALRIVSQEEIKKHFWASEALFPDFGAKIKIVRLLGLIGPKTTANLEVIRLVRNAFAHSMADIYFTTHEVETACAQLTLSDNAAIFVEKQTSKFKSRHRFCHACDEIFRGMINYVGGPFATGAPRPAGLPPHPILP